MSLRSATNFTQNWFFSGHFSLWWGVSTFSLRSRSSSDINRPVGDDRWGQLMVEFTIGLWYLLFWQAPGFYYHQAISRAMWWTTWFSPLLFVSNLNLPHSPSGVWSKGGKEKKEKGKKQKRKTLTSTSGERRPLSPKNSFHLIPSFARSVKLQSNPNGARLPFDLSFVAFFFFLLFFSALLLLFFFSSIL